MAYRASAAKKLYSNQNTLSINLIKLPLNMDTSAAVFGITIPISLHFIVDFGIKYNLSHDL